MTDDSRLRGHVWHYARTRRHRSPFGHPRENHRTPRSVLVRFQRGHPPAAHRGNLAIDLHSIYSRTSSRYTIDINRSTRYPLDDSRAFVVGGAGFVHLDGRILPSPVDAACGVPHAESLASHFIRAIPPARLESLDETKREANHAPRSMRL